MRGASRAALATAEDELDGLLAGSKEAARPLAEGLLQVTRLLSDEIALARSMGDPGVDADARRALVDAVFGGKVPAELLGLLQTVAAERWSSTEDLVDGVELLGARAAFTMAEADGSLDDVEDELFRFARIVDATPDLRTALGDPSLPREAKHELIGRLLEGKASDVTVLLVDAVVAAPRGRPVDRAVDALADAAAARREREIAVVTSAVVLTDDQREQLTEALARALGRGVRLQTGLDPSILGGVVVRVGDQLFDGSVRLRLAEARTRLAR